MKWTRWQVAGLSAVVLLYLALATYKISRPGLYYDEMLFVGPAARQSPYLKCFGLPLLTFPYIGALKAWLYTPVFALFGVSPLTIRLPVILVACGTLIIRYLFVRRALAPAWALAFTAACCIHPGFVFLTKIDWGPVSLMFFFKALCLLLLFDWFRNERIIPWFFCGACLLGFFDKFNFVWFLVALAIATPTIYGRELLAKIGRIPRRLLLILGGVLAAVGFLAFWIVLPLLQMPHMHGLLSRIQQVWKLYESGVTGEATAYLWFKSPPVVPQWTGWVLPVATIVLLLLSWPAYLTNTDPKRRFDFAALRLCLWSLCMFGVIFAEIVFTPQAGGPHHTIMLFPFDLLAAFSAAFLLARSTSAGRNLIITLEACFLLAWGIANAQSFKVTFDRFKDVTSFRGRWSPDQKSLVRYLDQEGKNVDFIYTIDWGIGFQLRALCQPEISRKVRDAWPTFLGWSPQAADAESQVQTVFPATKTSLYVGFTPAEAVFPEALKKFGQIDAQLGDPAKKVTNLPPAVARNYQVFETK